MKTNALLSRIAFGKFALSLSACILSIGLNAQVSPQPFEITLLSSGEILAPDAPLNICPGEEVPFEVEVDYPLSGTEYAQSNATSQFSWSTDGGEFAGNGSLERNITFEESGGFYLIVQVTDVMGFAQTALRYVQVDVTPDFSGLAAANAGPFYAGETATIVGGVNMNTGEIAGVTLGGGTYSVGASFDTYLDLPDGGATAPQNPEYYSTNLPIGNFPQGQTLSDVNTFTSVCVNMHHTYVGDLEMWLVSPNSTDTLLLFDGYYDQSTGVGLFPGGGLGADGSNLGNTGALEGYEYCFTPNADTTLENQGTTNEYPAGDYLPMGSFDDLLGAELNGIWTLQVGDYFGSDAEAIVDWSINFNEQTMAQQISFSSSLLSSYWTNDPSIINETQTGIEIQPTAAGTYSYLLTVLSDVGCSYDTTLTIEVLEPLGLDELDNLGFSLNASEGTISLNRFDGSNGSPVSARLYDGQGRLLSNVQFASQYTFTVTDSGVYLIELLVDESRAIQRVLVV